VQPFTLLLLLCRHVERVRSRHPPRLPHVRHAGRVPSACSARTQGVLRGCRCAPYCSGNLAGAAAAHEEAQQAVTLQEAAASVEHASVHAAGGCAAARQHARASCRAGAQRLQRACSRRPSMLPRCSLPRRQPGKHWIGVSYFLPTSACLCQSVCSYNTMHFLSLCYLYFAHIVLHTRGGHCAHDALRLSIPLVHAGARSDSPAQGLHSQQERDSHSLGVIAVSEMSTLVEPHALSDSQCKQERGQSKGGWTGGSCLSDSDEEWSSGSGNNGFASFGEGSRVTSM